MEYKTCEQYVLAELESLQARCQAGEEAKQILDTLQQLFYVEDTPDGSGINIGVRDELFNTEKDPRAVDRIMLLRRVFGVPSVRAAQAAIDAGVVSPMEAQAAAIPAPAPGPAPASVTTGNAADYDGDGDHLEGQTTMDQFVQAVTQQEGLQ